MYDTMNNIVGSRWWKFDFHAHSPASCDYQQRDISPRDWLLGHIEQGVECVAVTDHNTNAWIDRLLLEAQSLRREGYSIYVFPGVELSTAGNVHVLAIFDPSVDAQRVAAVIGAAGYTGTYGESDTVCTKSPEDVVKEITEKFSGVAIPAHIDLEASGLCKLGHMTVERVCQVSDAVEIVHPKKESLSCFNSTKASASLPKIIGSDSHAPNQNGRAFTWVKMASPSIDGLKLALLDGNTCIRRSDESFTPNTLPTMYIKELEISNTKYCGRGNPFRVRFNPWLNSIVGSRGSGKSTLAEFIRIALHKTDEILKLEDHNEIRRNFERFFRVAQNRHDHGVILPDSLIKCVFTKNDIDYCVSWQRSNNSFIIERNDNQQWIPEVGDVKTRFPVSIYSQKQIFDMAKDPNTLLSIIDNSKEVNIRDWKKQWDELRDEFLRLRAEELSYRNRISNISNIQGQLADVNAKIAHIEASGHAQILQNYNNLYNQKSYVTNVFSLMQGEINNLIRGITDSKGAISYGIEEAISADPSLVTVVQQLSTSISEWKTKSIQELGAISVALQIRQKTLDGTMLSQLCTEAYNQYTQLFSTLQQQGIKEPSEYDVLVKTRIELSKKLDELNTTNLQLAHISTKINDAYQRLIALRQELTNRRRVFIERYVTPYNDLKITISQLQNIEHLEQSFRAIINRADGSYASDLLDAEKRLGILFYLKEGMAKADSSNNQSENAYSVLHQFKLDFCNHVTSKEAILGCTIGKRFSSVIEQLDSSNHDRLCSWFPEDNLSVEFNDGRKFKPLSQGSAGQKAAAVLTFLLSYGDEPLIVDQPEDDLDNALISKLVIKKIHAIKPKRQLLIITHNPNIVVNGDSELVIVLEDRGLIGEPAEFGKNRTLRFSGHP